MFFPGSPWVFLASSLKAFCLLVALPLLASCSTSPGKVSSPPGPPLSPPGLEDLLLPLQVPSFQPLPQKDFLSPPLRVLLSRKSFASSSALESWKKAWEELKHMGKKEGPALAGILLEGPPQSRMAAATLLGCLSSRALLPLCKALDDPDPEVAAAAAFALGDLGDPRALPRLLLEVLPAPSLHAPVVRAAAASSLLQLGCAQGVPFLLGLLQAGTPGNGPLARTFYLPEKDRWALEKEIGLRALRRLAGKRFGLEPEQSWADLKRGAASWLQWWTREGSQRVPPLAPPAREVLRKARSRVQEAFPRLKGKERLQAAAWLQAASRALQQGVE